MDTFGAAPETGACFGIAGLVKGPSHQVVLVDVCGIEIKSVSVLTNGVVIAVRNT